ETSLKLCDELRSNLILKTGGTESVQMILHQKLVCGICQETLTIDLPISSKTNTPLVEDQCVVINIGTELPDTTRNVRLGSTELGLLATIGLQIIHIYKKPCVVILSTDSNEIILMSALKYTTCYLLSLWHYI
ncbi:unnamed protein product, partial [Rotaria socialis]